jgi:uncharacterized protein (DUF1499 family)
MSITEKKAKPINRSLLAVIGVLLIVAIWIGVRIVFPNSPTLFAGTRPDNLGVSAGKLAPCPSTPNCVSSQSQDVGHFIEPLTYQSSAREAIAALKQIIESQPRTKIIAETDNYLYAEFATPWMGFVDDVEFSIQENPQIIEVRSASRLGESDLGVNRQRIEQIRSKL